MKIKTDLYTKIVLTVIAVFLGALVAKDIDFVTTAQAGELNLSGLKVEQAENDGEITYYLYENEYLQSGFGTEDYIAARYQYWPNSIKPKSLDQAYIEQEYDFPKYIITTRTGTFMLKK